MEITYIDRQLLFALSELLAQEVELWTRLGEPRKPAQRKRERSFINDGPDHSLTLLLTF